MLKLTLSLNKRTPLSIGHHLSHVQISHPAHGDPRALLGGSLFPCALVQDTQMWFGVGISYANVRWLSASPAEWRKEKQLLRRQHVILFIHEQLDGKTDRPSTVNSKINTRASDYILYSKNLDNIDILGPLRQSYRSHMGTWTWICAGKGLQTNLAFKGKLRSHSHQQNATNNSTFHEMKLLVFTEKLVNAPLRNTTQESVAQNILTAL